jgi:hypothetical protein
MLRGDNDYYNHHYDNSHQHNDKHNNNNHNGNSRTLPCFMFITNLSKGQVRRRWHATHEWNMYALVF